MTMLFKWWYTSLPRSHTHNYRIIMLSLGGLESIKHTIPPIRGVLDDPPTRTAPAAPPGPPDVTPPLESLGRPFPVSVGLSILRAKPPHPHSTAFPAGLSVRFPLGRFTAMCTPTSRASAPPFPGGSLRSTAKGPHTRRASSPTGYHRRLFCLSRSLWGQGGNLEPM